MDYQKEIKRLSLELMSLKNSVSLIQAEPVLNNLPGSSLNTPNLSIKEYSSYQGPFRCGITNGGRYIKIGSGKVFFGNDLVHDYPGQTLPMDHYNAKTTRWIGLECEISDDPTDFGADATTVGLLSLESPIQSAGHYCVWLARIIITSYRVTYIEQRWQGGDVNVPIWHYCDKTVQCVDAVEGSIPGKCLRVAQLESPACNPGFHLHSVIIDDNEYLTDCRCRESLES